MATRALGPPTAGLADSIISLLKTRQLHVTAAVQHRVETCADVGLLDHWLSRASAVDLAEDIFEN